MRSCAPPSQPGNRSLAGARPYGFLAAFALLMLLAMPASAQVPPDSVILRMVQERIESGNGVGAVVGIVAADGTTRVIAWQKSEVEGPRLNRSTVFEIGSLPQPIGSTRTRITRLPGCTRSSTGIRRFAPLDMTSTAIMLDASMGERLAAGHGQNGNVVPNWHLPTFAGAGALRSTVDDMMKFVEAVAPGSAHPARPRNHRVP